MSPRVVVVLLLLLLSACGNPTTQTELHVAAAANLSRIFPELARECKKQTDIVLVPSFGATAMLAQQIENGGPFDLFLSADTEHVDALGKKGLLAPEGHAVYARGRLVIWAPRHPELSKVQDLANPAIKRIGMARPELAPYGKASIETLTAFHLWPSLESKVVYGQSISAVKQFVDSSNADAAFIALSLVKEDGGHYVEIEESLHQPIDQALGVIKAGKNLALTQRAKDFLLGPDGQSVFRRAGYLSAR